MINGLRATWRGLGNLQQRGYSYIWTNLAFVALSLPVITLPAAYSALMRVGHLAHTDPGEADLASFWQTFKDNFGRALGWGVANALFAVVNFNNILAFGHIDSVAVAALETVWILATLVWLGMLLYTWPIYYEMEEPTVWGAARNALVMVLRNPLFTLIILTILTVLAVLSTILIASWLLLTCGAIAAVSNAAVQDRLTHYRQESMAAARSDGAK